MLALANKLSLTTQPVYKFVNKYSIDFDGVDDRIITDGADTVLQNTTYSFWCKTTTTGLNLVFAHGYYQRGGFAFNWSSDRPILRIGADKWIMWNDTSAQDDGEWHHWVVYLNAENITESKLYVDATLQTVSATSNTGSIDAYTTSLIIGNDGGAFDYTGKIDEFAVYDRELTQAEITKIYNDGSPINLNLNAGDYQSANPLITSTKSMEFDATQYLSVGSDCPAGNFTVTSWVKKTGTGGWYAIFSASTQIWFGLNDNGRILAHVGGPSFSTTGAVDINKWHNCTLTWDGTASFIYVDGVQVATSTGTNNPSATAYDIGKLSTSNNNHFVGYITELGLYDRALTSLEVASLYNQGVPTDLLVSRGDYVATGLQGYWKMGDGTNDEYPVIYDQVDPTLGSEVVTNGDFATDLSSWTGQAGRGSYSWDNGKAKITNDDASSYPNLSQSITTVVGKVYKITATVEIGTATLIEVRAYSNSNIGSQQLTTDGTIEFYITADDTDFTLHLYLFETGNTGHYCYYDNVSVKEVQGNPATMTNMVEGNITNQYPLTKIRNYYRMGDGILDGYPIIQDQTSPNLAHIPTTNLITYSEDFSNAYWTKDRTTVVSGQLSPLGDTSAFKLVEDTTVGNHKISTSVIFVSSGITNTYSIHIKAAERTKVGIREEQHGGKYATFNLLTKTIISNTGLTANIISLSNDWVRINFSQSSGGGLEKFSFFLLNDGYTSGSPSSYTYTGDGTSGVFIYGAQLEEQSQATAYIKSDGIAAVRKSSTTNLLSYSEDFSQSAWQKSNITATPNSIISPDGTLNAYKLTKPTSSAPRLFELSVYPSTGVHTFTSFYKNLDGDSVLIRLDAGGNTANCTVDLTTNTLVNSGANIISSNITQLSDGWIRVSVTANILSTSWVLDAANLFDLSVGSSVYIWGAQLEEQTQAETYAKTTGLPVTIDLFTENNYGTMTNMSASDIVEDTP